MSYVSGLSILAGKLNSPFNDASLFTKRLNMDRPNGDHEGECAMVLELDLVGNVRFLSKSWRRIVGTNPSKIVKRPIGDFIVGGEQDKNVFGKATEIMLIDDETYRVRFIVETNLRNLALSDKESSSGDDGPAHRIDSNDLEDDAVSVVSTTSTLTTDGDFIELDAQGILIHDKNGKPFHTMWIVKPWTSLKEVALQMPEELIGTLGFGTNLLESYLLYLMELEVTDEANLPPPSLEICRICEEKVPNWWLEKHTELCVIENRVQDMVFIKQEELEEHRLLLQNILDTLNKRTLPKSPPQSPLLKSTSTSSSSSISDASVNSVMISDYKGLPIPMSPQIFDGHVRRKSVSSSLLPQIRFPFKNIEQLISYCDEALLINPGEIKQNSKPNSPSFNWNSKSSNVEQSEVAYSPNSAKALKSIRELELPTSADPAISALRSDTLDIVEQKLEALRRYAHILQYCDRIVKETEMMIAKVVSNIIKQINLQVFSGDDSEMGELDDILSPRNTCFNEQILRPQPTRPMRGDFKFIDRSRSQSPLARSKSPLSNHNTSPLINIPTTPSNPGLFNNSYVYPDHKRTKSRDDMLFSGTTSNASMSNLKSSKDPLSIGSSSGSATPILGTPRASSSSIRTTTAILNTQNHIENRSNSGTRNVLTPAPHTSDEIAQRLKRHSNSSTPIRATSPNNGFSTNLSNLSGYTLPLSSIQRTRVRSDSNANSLIGVDSSTMGSPLASPILTASDPIHKSSVPMLANNYLKQLTNTVGQPPLSPLLLAQGSSKATHLPSIKDYEPVKPISKGAFGSVFLAKRKLTGDYVAIKILKKSDMIAKNQVLNVKAERAIMMAQTDSPYVVQLIKSFQSANYLYLVMEYLNGGDLATLLKNIGSLPEAWAKRYIAEVVIEVEDLHFKGIIHRDLKPDNLLIDNRGHVRLTDFGLSRMGLVNRQKAISAVMSGTPRRSSSLTTNPVSSANGSFSFPSTNVQAIENPFKSFSLNEPSKASLQPITPLSLGPQNQQPCEGTDDLSSMNSFASPVLQMEYKSRARTISNASDISMRSSLATRPKQLSIANSLTHSGEDTPMRNLSITTTDSDHFSLQPHMAADSPKTYALFDPSHTTQIKKFVGTPDYLAPETVAGAGQDASSDWWSIGCIMFEFLFGYPPFNDETPERVFVNILNHEIQWPKLSEEEFRLYCSDEAKDLITKLLVKDPAKRIGSLEGSTEIKRHPYFKGVNWDTLFEEEASFVPSADNPESTDYFDARGADMSTFPTEGSTDGEAPETDEEDEIEEYYNSHGGRYLGEETISSDNESAEGIYEEDNTCAITEDTKPITYKVLARSSSSSSSATMDSPRQSFSSRGAFLGQRDRRGSKLVDPNPSEFGSFQFRNISVLEKQNKDAINRLKSEHLEHSSRNSLSSVGSMEYFGSQGGSSSGSMGYNSTPQTPNQQTPQIPLLVIGSKAKGGHLFKSPTDKSPILSNMSSPPIVHQRRDSGSSAMRIFSRNYKGSMSNESSSDTDEKSKGTKLRMLRGGKSKKKSDKVLEGLDLEIVVCEPIPINRFSICKNLKEFGYKVVTCGTGTELIKKISSTRHFDVIFISMNLQNLDTMDLVKLIRNTNGINKGAIVVSMSEWSKDFEDNECVDYELEYPITMGKLRRLFGEVCQRRNAEEVIYSDTE